MRKRLGSTTIRTRIVSLVTVPLVALAVVVGFSGWSMTSDTREMVQLEAAYRDFGVPVDTAGAQIEVERRLAAEYLGSGGDRSSLADYTAQQRATDQALEQMRAAIANRAKQDEVNPGQRARLNDMVRASDGLTVLRQDVIARRIGWDQAIDRYTPMVEPVFSVRSALTAAQAGRAAREARVVVELARVREFVSREDAMGSGARAAGGFTPAQYKAFAAAVEDRRVFQRAYVPELPSDSRAQFDAFTRDRIYAAMEDAEDSTLINLADGGKASWRAQMDPAIQRYMELIAQVATNSAARSHADSVNRLIRVWIQNGISLAALIFSIWYSVRTGRWITRRMLRLRTSVRNLTLHQLPSVVRRLGAGEEVDAEVEAPPIDAGEDELGDIGRAINEARSAGLAAAAEQARLRVGISGVFLNIARRNQSLIHRQLKQLDAMERRAVDPDQLADLYRVDHLATRMRRHAEGLIILSGAAPGRMWRKPVPLVDVVGSAVGTVEQYERVVIPPMPKVALVGAAVGDLAHLFAELIENATVFSPPQTQVTMRATEVANGCVLEIDDRGLGMDEDQLAAANFALAEPQEFDPTRTERLGLFVVARLAQRHGVEVTLRRSPYGGTTVVVLMPRAILATVEPEPEREHEPTRELEEPAPVRELEPAGAQAAAVLPMRRRNSTRSAPQARERESAPEAVSADEMAAIFGAFQRGVNRGRVTDAERPGA